MLRIGDRVRVVECGCHEMVQPRHTGKTGTLSRCYYHFGSPAGDMILLPVQIDGGGGCYAGDVELVVPVEVI